MRLIFRSSCRRAAPTWRSTRKIGPLTSEKGIAWKKWRSPTCHIQVGPNKDTAVASYILHVRTKLKDGKIAAETNQESDVMFKRNGEWKVVFCTIPARAEKIARHKKNIAQPESLFSFGSNALATKTLKGLNERTQRPKTWHGPQYHQARFPEWRGCGNWRGGRRIDASWICVGGFCRFRSPLRISPDTTRLRSPGFAEVMGAPSNRRTHFATGKISRKRRGAKRPAGEYDLVIVGGGISGLAAAYFGGQKIPNARILILDNHDDFGGHAKRNELRAAGRMLLANGGTWAIESPFAYSKVARD